MTLVGRIHAAAKLAGLDDDTRRAKLQNIVGKSSTRDMTPAERRRVLEVFENEGYASRKPPRVDGRTKKLPFDGKYVPKFRALWIALYNLGVIDDRRDSAIEAFALGRQVKGLSDVRFIHHHRDGESVVEGMKAMLTRAGVDFADHRPCPDYMLKYGYKIARAQWALLSPVAPRDFWPVVTDLIDQDETHRDLSDKEWIDVMNLLGERVRKLKKVRA
ncbi:regulatory protein GemA [Shinella sp.]|uniref:regulatory protein GemA n=1 Tax=Shinella sp. TaxID=1870904 RepID=UPI0039E383C0